MVYVSACAAVKQISCFLTLKEKMRASNFMGLSKYLTIECTGLTEKNFLKTAVVSVVKSSLAHPFRHSPKNAKTWNTYNKVIICAHD